MISEFVIDNSIVMAWCFKDETALYPQKVLEALSHCEAVAPSIWPLEVCNVLAIAERKKRLSKSDSTRFLALLNDLPVFVEQETPERIFSTIFSLARERCISTYDASYLDLSIRLGMPLATQDSGLRSAARKCHVPLFEP